MPGTATARASVAPATYGPCSRAAATPTTAPTTSVTAVAASSTTGSGSDPSGSWSSSAVVYAPTAMKAPWPSESCPDRPRSRLSPPAAMPV